MYNIRTKLKVSYKSWASKPSQNEWKKPSTWCSSPPNTQITQSSLKNSTRQLENTSPNRSSYFTEVNQGNRPLSMCKRFFPLYLRSTFRALLCFQILISKGIIRSDLICLRIIYNLMGIISWRRFMSNINGKTWKYSFKKSKSKTPNN